MSYHRLGGPARIDYRSDGSAGVAPVITEDLLVCDECSAVVAQVTVHDRWHAHLRRIEQDASSALTRARRPY